MIRNDTKFTLKIKLPIPDRHCVICFLNYRKIQMCLLVVSVRPFPYLLAEKETYKNHGFFCDSDSWPGKIPAFLFVFFSIKYRMLVRFIFFTLFVISLIIALVLITKNDIGGNIGLIWNPDSLSNWVKTFSLSQVFLFSNIVSICID